jgi:polysaccharide biosynthesis protein PslF
MLHTVVPVPPTTLPVVLSTGIGDARVGSVGILSTFPPTSCGIATFSAALAAGLVADGLSVDVVRCGPSPEVEDVLVVASLADETSTGWPASIEALNRNELVIVQHEYGLYDGADGESLLDLLDALDVPIVVVAHTVLSEPSPNQQRVLERLCAVADAVVVMTETAEARLFAHFDVDRTKVSIIPHGAATPSAATPAPREQGARPRVLTWGLLGPGKGIEWAIDALDELGGLDPRPEYVVAGATHPKVREQHGEAYRDMLVERASASTAPADVSFDDTYRDLASLTELIASADVVVLPYDSREQVTSGVLVDAVAAGRPVVSTAFPHAIELLASGAGIVVPQRDPVALGVAIRSVLADPGLAASMAAEARRLAPELAWSAVAHRYSLLADRVVASRQPLRS